MWIWSHPWAFKKGPLRLRSMVIPSTTTGRNLYLVPEPSSVRCNGCLGSPSTRRSAPFFAVANLVISMGCRSFRERPRAR